MKKNTRSVIRIDDGKCDGCGLCADACAEGAIAIVDGKAKLVSEAYCDGLGACLGECPQGAITIEQREAPGYDEAATRAHLSATGRDPDSAHRLAKPHAAEPAPRPAASCPPPHVGHDHGGGCPGSRMRVLRPRPAVSGDSAGRVDSRLAQWPVQLSLVPANAPYFRGADLLVTADCVPFAYAEFHRDFLDGKALVVGCPKLDDVDYYRDKLTQIFRTSGVRSATVLLMEVPCCSGLLRATLDAVAASGRALPVTAVTIGVGGEVLGRESFPARAGSPVRAAPSEGAG